MIVNPSAKPRGKPPNTSASCGYPQWIEKGRGKPPFTRHVSNIPDVIGRARGDPKGIFPELESDRGVIPHYTELWWEGGVILEDENCKKPV